LAHKVAHSRIRLSENASSTIFVNKGKEKGRGCQKIGYLCLV
jgi:hypothetical protein